MPSPSKDANPSLAQASTSSHLFHNPGHAELAPPASPRTHRTLRRLQSAHTLGASNTRVANQSSLVSQQRREQQRSASPTRHRAPSTDAPPPANSHNIKVSDGSNPLNLSPTKVRTTASGHRSPQRGRANSDATAPLVHQMNAVTAAKRMGTKKPVFSHGHLSLQQIIKDGPTDGDYNGALESARWKVVDEGIKSAEDGMSTLRIYVWLVLLAAPVMATDDYLALVHKGASPAYAKIRNDTFRTLTTDPLFRRRVSEASLIRVLNAVAWKLHDANEAQRIEDGEEPITGRASLPRHSFGGSVSGASQASKCLHANDSHSDWVD